MWAVTMSSQWINIDKLGTKGMEPDLMPPHRDPQSLDTATNVRALGPNLANAGGYLVVTDTGVPVDANTLFPARTDLERSLVIAGDTSIWQFNGSTWSDITGDPVDDGLPNRASGGWLTGALTIANQLVVRTFKPGVDATTQPMVYDGGLEGTGETWEELDNQAAVFRPFRSYMLAGNPTWAGANYPTRVQWSNPVEPGQVPDDWVTRDTNRAGDVDLADTPGDVVEMAPLRDAMIIYKQDSIYTCNWIGGNEVFSFRRLTTNKGLHARDAAIEHNGFHWCQGIEDIFLVDGNSTKSLIWGRVKRTWLAERDPEFAQCGFTVLDPVNEEVLFFFVSKNNIIDNCADMALVLSLNHNNFFFRDYSTRVPHAKVGLDVVDQSSANLVFYGIDKAADRLLDLEAAPDRVGSPVPASIQRTGLFSDPGHDWVQVDQAKLQLSGQAATLTLGDQIAIDAPVTWRQPFTVDPATDYKTDARANGNLVAYKIDISTLTNWQISNLNLLVQKSGERG